MRVLPNIVSATLGVILLAGAIGSAQADTREKHRGGGTATGQPVDTMPVTTPECITPTLDAAGEGRRAYMRMNCYSCHGSDAHGASMGPSLVGEADETAEAVLEGEDGGMPSFKGHLCEGDIANLEAYLQLLGSGTEPTFVRWWEPNPSR